MAAFARSNGTVLHYDFAPGDASKRAIVFSNSLGTDLRIWDGVRARLDPSIPVLAMDKRGHGLSDLSQESGTPVAMADHVGDLAGLMDQFGLRDALVCGVSVGGMIVQGLAASRPELCAGLVLCNTGAKIGDAESWNSRIEAVRERGLDTIADAVLERWFSQRWRQTNPTLLAGYRNMLTRTPGEGYAGTCEALRDADYREQTATLKLPALCIAGGADLATPPELVRALCGLIEGARFQCFEDVGHLPCLEVPEKLAPQIAGFYDTLA